MSRNSKALTAAKLNDLILGCFSNIKPSETLDHLARFLSTWGGSDKLFMLIQYAVKLIVPFAHLRAKLQYKAGLRKSPTSRAAESYNKIYSLVGDARMLWRIWGLLPIFQWLISLERSPPATRKLLTIERLQGWSMLAYYPLEHLYYLVSHNIIPSTLPSPTTIFSSKKKRINLDANTLGIWSTRFWALYVFLHFAHLWEDRKLLKQRQTSLRKAKGTGLTQAEKSELGQRWDAFWSEVVINIGYLPLTVHWSLEKGLFKNDIWVGVFGMIASVASFRTGWKATALPPTPPAPEVKEEKVDESSSPVAGYEVSS
ncbi:hypothetical protein BJ165DRAFT_1354867 [Panaeolus papilionaceus]|nr:hypothetical protein BJ165DRAFT_1354867 [Panaeolus papilionaceus]